MTKSSHILICHGTACVSSESREVYKALEKAIDEAGLADQVRILHTGCFGFCARGPIILIHPGGVMYCEVSVGDVKEIVEEHIKRETLLSACCTGIRKLKRKRPVLMPSTSSGTRPE